MSDPITARRVAYQVPGMERAQVRRNLTFKETPEGELQADLYYPHHFSGTCARPAVILVHGDVPADLENNAKDWGQFVSYGHLVASAELIAITFNHRSSERFTQLEQVAADVEDLIRYVRAHAGELQVDPDCLCLWTFDSGAPYGLRMAIRDTPAYIRCLVAYGGLMTLEHMDRYVAPMVTPAALAAFSLSRWLAGSRQSLPPLLLVKAGQDRPLVNESIDRFVAEALRQNIPLDYLTHEHGPTAFDVTDPGERTQEIIRSTLEYIRFYLGAGTTHYDQPRSR